MDRGNYYFKIAKQYLLGYDDEGNDHEENIDKAIYYFEEARNFGNNEVLYELGLIYFDDNKHDKALEYLEQALKNGIQDAYNELLEVYFHKKLWGKYLSLFFKRYHNEKECNNFVSNIDYYYHRAGRTGRYKEKGDSYIFYDNELNVKSKEILEKKLKFDYFSINKKRR